MVDGRGHFRIVATGGESRGGLPRERTGVEALGNGRGCKKMMAEKMAPVAGRHVAAAGTLVLVLPECEKGLGKIIGAIDSPDLIAGVRVAQLSVYPDDRGYFMEVQRFGRGLAADFPAATSQFSAALNYPGSV